MENKKTNDKNQSVRKKIYKKAAVLATMAAITGATATGMQKPKEAKSLVGLIMTIVGTVVGVGSTIGSTVKQANDADNNKTQEALNTPDGDIRLQQELDEEKSKKIDISIANNQDEEVNTRITYTKTNSKPKPVKDLNVGGFGVEESTEDLEVQNDEEVTEDLEVQNEDLEVQNNEEVTEDLEDNKPQKQEKDNNKNDDNGFSYETEDEIKDDEENIVKEDVYVYGSGTVGVYDNEDNENEEYIEVMSREEAENHDLVLNGNYTVDELLFLDALIRTGEFTDANVVDFYNEGQISYEEADNLLNLMQSIYEDMGLM